MSELKTFEKLTETEIIERVLKGEKSLYEVIVRRYNPYLYKVGRSYNLNHEDTQDMMQDTYVDAFKALVQFEQRANFKTWIIRIMLNNCFRKKQKHSFKNESTFEDMHEHATPMFTNINNNTDNLIHNKEIGKAIEKSLSKVPEEYRMVFSLREINGLSVAETADTLNISEANVKVRLTRAKTMLRELIKKS